MNNNKILNIKETAERLRVSESTIRRRVHDGTFKPLPYTRQIYFTESMIEKILAGDTSVK